MIDRLTWASWINESRAAHSPISAGVSMTPTDTLKALAHEMRSAGPNPPPLERVSAWAEALESASQQIGEPWGSAASHANLPDELDPKQVASACFAFRHDYGLLDDPARADLEHQCREWWRAILKELRVPSRHPMVLDAAAQLLERTRP